MKQMARVLAVCALTALGFAEGWADPCKNGQARDFAVAAGTTRAINIQPHATPADCTLLVRCFRDGQELWNEVLKPGVSLCAVVHGGTRGGVLRVECRCPPDQTFDYYWGDTEASANGFSGHGQYNGPCANGPHGIMRIDVPGRYMVTVSVQADSDCGVTFRGEDVAPGGAVTAPLRVQAPTRRTIRCIGGGERCAFDFLLYRSVPGPRFKLAQTRCGPAGAVVVAPEPTAGDVLEVRMHSSSSCGVAVSTGVAPAIRTRDIERGRNAFVPVAGPTTIQCAGPAGRCVFQYRVLKPAHQWTGGVGAADVRTRCSGGSEVVIDVPLSPAFVLTIGVSPNSSCPVVVTESVRIAAVPPGQTYVLHLLPGRYKIRCAGDQGDCEFTYALSAVARFGSGTIEGGNVDQLCRAVPEPFQDPPRTRPVTKIVLPGCGRHFVIEGRTYPDSECRAWVDPPSGTGMPLWQRAGTDANPRLDDTREPIGLAKTPPFTRIGLTIIPWQIEVRIRCEQRTDPDRCLYAFEIRQVTDLLDGLR